MKTLKESILNRSSHGVKGFEVQRRELIEKWLKEYNIKDYTINDDSTIDVDGTVYLFRRGLTELPDYIKFNIVKGDFYCMHDRLTSLKGFPVEVGGKVYINDNQLTSLKGPLKKVGRGLNCSYN